MHNQYVGDVYLTMIEGVSNGFKGLCDITNVEKWLFVAATTQVITGTRHFAIINLYVLMGGIKYFRTCF